MDLFSIQHSLNPERPLTQFWFYPRDPFCRQVMLYIYEHRLDEDDSLQLIHTEFGYGLTSPNLRCNSLRKLPTTYFESEDALLIAPRTIMDWLEIQVGRKEGITLGTDKTMLRKKGVHDMADGIIINLGAFTLLIPRRFY